MLAGSVAFVVISTFVTDTSKNNFFFLAVNVVKQKRFGIPFSETCDFNL